MKYCPKCNISNEDYNTVCSYCGFPLEDTTKSVNNSTIFDEQPISNEQPKTNGFAIASMVLGIASIPLLCGCCIGPIAGILAVVFGFIAKNKIKDSLGAEKGDGMALAGIILGFCTIGICIILIIICVVSPQDSNSFWNRLQEEMSRRNLEEY